MADEPDFLLHPEPARARAAADDLFERMVAILRPVLPPATDILHVGSTAIPGCLTKGDLDIVVRVRPADFAAADAVLAARLTRNTGSARTDSFAAFEDATTEPHLGVQLAVVGGPFDDFHRFAAALLHDSALVERYNALKTQFHGRPMAEYRAAKDAFIVAVLEARPTDFLA
jgi:GrpB-like predicted nucleotidyltransferase (UPF0157 family)